MVCPMRLNTKMEYESNEKIKAVVLTSKEETYPECYGEECPWYDTKYVTDENNKVVTKGICRQVSFGSGGEVIAYDD